MVNRYSFDNGLKVISKHIPNSHVLNIGIWLPVGSKYEQKNNNGIFHFIEHMLFKGINNNIDNPHYQVINMLGGEINAFTGQETTCYYIRILNEYAELAIFTLSDMMFNFAFNESDIEIEKNVIYEELKIQQEQPSIQTGIALASATWGKNSLSLPVIGSGESIKNFDKKLLIKYLDKYYNPENMVISITGDCEKTNLLELIDKYFAKYKNKIAIHERNYYSIPLINKNIVVVQKSIDQIHLAFTFKGFKFGDKKLYPLEIINNFWANGTSSKLYNKLRIDNGYIYSIHSFSTSFQDIGIYNLYFSTSIENLDKIMNIIMHEIDNIKNDKMNLNDTILEKYKNQIKAQYIMGNENYFNQMINIGYSEVMGKTLLETEDYLRAINEIGKKDIDEVFHETLNHGIFSVGLLANEIDCIDAYNIVNYYTQISV